MLFSQKLTPYMEVRVLTQKPPLFQGAVIKFGKHRFPVEKWNIGDSYCYVFNDTAEQDPYKPFAKKPSEIRQLIADKKIIVEKLHG